MYSVFIFGHSIYSIFIYGHIPLIYSILYLLYFPPSVYSAYTMLDRLEVNQGECMKLLVCEAQRAAPAVTALSTVMNIIRSLIHSLSFFSSRC